MAIAIDSSGGAYTRKASVTSITQAFNNVAGDFLVVGVANTSDADNVTGITYNGVAMTRAVGKWGGGHGECSFLYYLSSPATGSNNVVISFSSTCTADYGIASYTGVTTSSPIDGTFSAFHTAGSTYTETITTATDNCWMVVFIGLQRGSTASTNSTQRSGVSGGGNLFDSNSAITPAGSFSMTQTISNPATAVAFTFKPAGGGGGATYIPKIIMS